MSHDKILEAYSKRLSIRHRSMATIIDIVIHTKGDQVGARSRIVRYSSIDHASGIVVFRSFVAWFDWLASFLPHMPQASVG